MTDLIGQQLGSYQLIKLLGSGGFADVYLGEHVDLKRQAAIKVLHGALEPEKVEQFKTEAQRLAQLVHQHVIPLLDFNSGKPPYLVMAYAEGGTLLQRHPRGSIVPVKQVVEYVKQASEALQYAHDQGLIHRDVKPENLLLTASGAVMLSDFGIAAIAHGTTSAETGPAIGTVRYMSPEQLRGKATPASDQYSLATVVYEWLCGDIPFVGSNVERAIQRIVDDPQPLHERANVSPYISEVVQRALRKDPKQRHTDVREFAIAFGVAYAISVSPSTPTFHPAPLTAPDDSTTFISPGNMPTAPGQVMIGIAPSGPTTTVGQVPIHPSVISAGVRAPIPPTAPKSPKAGLPTVSRRSLIKLSALGGLGVAGVYASVNYIPELSAWIRSTYYFPSGTLLPRTFVGHAKAINAIAWSPDGKHIASGSSDHTVRIWEAASGLCTRVYTGHSEGVSCLSWSPDSKYVASGGLSDAMGPKTLQVWRASDGVQLFGSHEYIIGRSDPYYLRDIVDVSWSSTGKYLAVVVSGAVLIWNTTTGKIFRTLQPQNLGIEFSSVAWSPDEMRIATLSSDSINTILEVIAIDGESRVRYGDDSYKYQGDKVSWSKDGTQLLACIWSPDAGLISWNVAGRESTLSGDKAFTGIWSPNGRYIAEWFDNSLGVRDTKSSALLAKAEIRPADHFPYAWSPDSTYVAITSFDYPNEVRIWRPL